MKVLKYVMLSGFMILALHVFWQVGWSEFSNLELQDDLHDIASRLDVKTGWSGPAGDGEIRNKVINKASQHGIRLNPDQVMVEQSGDGENADIHVAANYEVSVTIVGDVAFNMHFSPSSE